MRPSIERSRGEDPQWRFFGRRHAEAIRDLLSSATDEALVVTPFISTPGIDFLLQALSHHRPKLKLLVNASARNSCARSCDPAALSGLLKDYLGVEVVSLPELHAKAYVADGRQAIVTSANLTAGGLWRNYEYGVRVQEPRTVAAILQDLAEYERVGTPLDETTVKELAECAAAFEEVAARNQADAQSAAVLRRAEDLLAHRYVRGRAPNAVFSEAVRFLLARDGPLTTAELHLRIRSLHPELCNDRIDRVINGRHFGKKWKHQVRTAQAHLKARGELALDDDARWRSAHVAERVSKQ